MISYFAQQNPSSLRIFGDNAKEEGIAGNLKNLNASALLLKNSTRVLLSSKQDFSFLNKGNNVIDNFEIITIKELCTKQWNEIKFILETAKEGVLT